MNARSQQRLSFAGWAAIATLAVVYAPMAVEYMWRFFTPDAPALWDHTMSTVVDHDEVYGAGSIHSEQTEAYEANRLVLLFHTTTGGIAILLFAAQFSTRFRSRLRRHRIVGRIAVTLALVGMVGAAAYLLSVGPRGTFDGPGFWIQLWGLAIGTAVAVSLGFVAAFKRQIAMHSALMALGFALLLTAPLLRIFYLLLGNAWPEVTQLETNFAGAAFLGTWAPLGAFLAARSQDLRVRPSPRIRPLPGRWVEVVVLAAAVVTTPVLVTRYADALGQVDRITVTGLVGFVAGLLVAVANLVSARRSDAFVAAEEWRVITLSLVATPPFALALWAVYDVWFTTGDAFLGTLLTGQALPLYLGFLVIVWRRRTVRASSVNRPGITGRDKADVAT